MGIEKDCPVNCSGKSEADNGNGEWKHCANCDTSVVFDKYVTWVLLVRSAQSVT